MDSTVPRVSLLGDEPVRILLQYESTLDLLHTLRSYLDEGAFTVETPVQLPAEASFTATFEVEGECRDLAVRVIRQTGMRHWLEPRVSPVDFGYLLETLGLDLDTFRLRRTLETCEHAVVGVDSVGRGFNLNTPKTAQSPPGSLGATESEIDEQPGPAEEEQTEAEPTEEPPTEEQPTEEQPTESAVSRFERLYGIFQEQKKTKAQANKAPPASPPEGSKQPKGVDSPDCVEQSATSPHEQDCGPGEVLPRPKARHAAGSQEKGTDKDENEANAELLADILTKMSDSEAARAEGGTRDQGPTGLHPAIREALEAGDMSAVSMSRFLNPAEIAIWIRDHHSGLTTQNHFEFLNVHWTASRKDLRKAILDARWTIAPEIINGLGDELEEMAEEVGIHLKLVEDTLMPQAERTHYRRSVVTKFEFDQAIALLRQRIDSARYLKDTARLSKLFDEVNELDPAAGPRIRAEIREEIERQKKARAKDDA